jgi:polyisoprenoid-binding protein YceI
MNARIGSRIALGAALLFPLSAPHSASAADAVWNIDPAHSSADFAIKHFALSTVKGAIPVTGGTVVLSPSSDIPLSVKATLDVSGIDTKDDDRNKDLRSPHWFDTATYPAGTFVSTGISGTDPAKFTIAGNLTLHGITKPVTLDAKLEGKGLGGRGEHRVAYSATTTIERKDFGLTNLATNATGDLVVGNEASISIEVEAIGPR